MSFLQPRSRREGRPRHPRLLIYPFWLVRGIVVVVLLPLLVAAAALAEGSERLVYGTAAAALLLLVWALSLRSGRGPASPRVGAVELPPDHARSTAMAAANLGIGTWLALTFVQTSGWTSAKGLLGASVGILLGVGTLVLAVLHRRGRLAVVLDPEGITWGFPRRHRAAWRDIQSVVPHERTSAVSLHLRSGGHASFTTHWCLWSTTTVAEAVGHFAGRSQHRRRLTDPSALDPWAADAPKRHLAVPEEPA